MTANGTRRLSAFDEALLREAAQGNEGVFAALVREVRAGEPAAYVAKMLPFRGRRFAIDARAYITDPELTHLIDAVGREGERIEQAVGRPPRIAEFGTGAGTLAVTLKLEHPGWAVVGLDIDDAALEVARENVRRHRADVTLVRSDFFDGWPEELAPPDLIFGDPPWGGETDLYSDDRDAGYYQRMPPKSAFPPGDNPCALHDELIARVRARRWRSRLVLNYGVLAPAIVERSTAGLTAREVVHPAPRLTIVSGCAGW